MTRTSSGWVHLHCYWQNINIRKNLVRYIRASKSSMLIQNSHTLSGTLCLWYPASTHLTNTEIKMPLHSPVHSFHGKCNWSLARNVTVSATSHVKFTEPTCFNHNLAAPCTDIIYRHSTAAKRIWALYQLLALPYFMFINTSTCSTITVHAWAPSHRHQPTPVPPFHGLTKHQC